jgi:hypothetical protein
MGPGAVVRRSGSHAISIRGRLPRKPSRRSRMRRREFMSGLPGATAAWPLHAWAQLPTKPAIGFLPQLPHFMQKEEHHE